jgi:hypothetical protein
MEDQRFCSRIAFVFCVVERTTQHENIARWLPCIPSLATFPESRPIGRPSEDKESIARPLYDALILSGVTVWFDEAILQIGDSLRRKIDEGLARCRYGIVIISQSFLTKEWPQRELDGLVAREAASGKKAILPIWHQIDRSTVMQYSPTLADSFGWEIRGRRRGTR